MSTKRMKLRPNPSTNRLAEVRKRLGLTQQQLAEKVGSHWVTISRLERGQLNITTGWSARIADALGIDEYDLYPPNEESVSIQISGTIGPTARARFYQPETPDVVTIKSNYWTSPLTKWFRVQSGVLYPWYQPNDLIAVGFSGESPEDLVGRFVCVLDDQGAFRFGILSNSRKHGSFDLEAPGLMPIRNIKVAQVGLVAMAVFAPTAELKAFEPGEFEDMIAEDDD